MACETIFKNITSNCSTARRAGLEPTAYIFSRKDATFTFSITQNKENTVTNIALASGKKAYKIQSTKKGINAGHTAVVSDTRPTSYQHYVTFESFEMLAEDLTNIDNLDDVVVVVETKQKTTTGEGVFIALGVVSGLYKAEDTRDFNTDSAVRKIKLQTQSGEEEAFSSYVLFTNDYATTKALLESLCS